MTTIIPTQNQYVGQLKTLSLDEITEEHFHAWMEQLTDRYRQLAHMRRDITLIGKEWAALNGYAYITDEDESYFIGPKSPKTHLSETLAQNGWITEVPISGRAIKRISTILEQMSTSGIRKKKASKPVSAMRFDSIAEMEAFIENKKRNNT